MLYIQHKNVLDCTRSQGIYPWNIGFHRIDSSEDQWYNRDTGYSICSSNSTKCIPLQQSVFWLSGFGKYAPYGKI